jgi:hypothetical protein
MENPTIVTLEMQSEFEGEEHSNARGRFKRNRQGGRKHRGFGKKLWKGIKKYNPASASIRAGALLGFDLNVLGISMRLYPALLTPEEAKKDGVKVEAIEKAKPAWEKAKKVWEKFGGDVSKLEKAIKKGARHKITKLKRKSGADGNDEYYFDDGYSNLVPVIAAGAVVLIAVAAILKKSEAMKQPFEDGEGGESEGGEGDGEGEGDGSGEGGGGEDDSSSADGSTTPTKKITMTAVAVGGILGLAYALQKKQNLKTTLGYIIVGGLIGYGSQEIFKNIKK